MKWTARAHASEQGKGNRSRLAISKWAQESMFCSLLYQVLVQLLTLGVSIIVKLILNPYWELFCSISSFQLAMSISYFSFYNLNIIEDKLVLYPLQSSHWSMASKTDVTCLLCCVCINHVTANIMVYTCVARDPCVGIFSEFNISGIWEVADEQLMSHNNDPTQINTAVLGMLWPLMVLL